jgi:hypothetical protein
MVDKMHPSDAFVEVKGRKQDNMSRTYLLLGMFLKEYSLKYIF